MRRGWSTAERLTWPCRGDLLAAGTVALVLVPQSLAYAELAGMPVVTGLYTAVAATLAAGLVGSSRYLQTGPVALTSLLTFGALSSLASAGSAEYVALAAMLPLTVGLLRILIGLVRWGFIAYLMSQPVVTPFTVAASLLILLSQVPGLLDVPGDHASPVLAAVDALGRPDEWSPTPIVIGIGMIGLILLGRRLSPLFPGAFIGTVAAVVVTRLGVLSATEVGEVPRGLPVPSLDLPWADATALLLPGMVIALVGFAEAASIARHYAAEDRERWNPDREFVGQGLANVAAGVFQGIRPAAPSRGRRSIVCPGRGRAGAASSRV